MKVPTWGGEAFKSRVRNIATNPELCADLDYGSIRDHRAGWIQDVYDGELYQDAVQRLPEGKKVMLWRITSDPAEFQDAGGSLTPVTLSNLTQSPMVRDRYAIQRITIIITSETLIFLRIHSKGAMHILALMPRECKNWSLIAPYVLADWSGPDGIGLDGRGVLVKKGGGWSEDRWFCHRILFSSNDTRGLPIVNLGMQDPAVHGACQFCKLVGLRLAPLGRTMYCSAITHEPVGAPVRTAFMER